MTTAMMSEFKWVSEEQVNAARAALESGEKKCCPMCRHYATPGFIHNAGQWVRCFDCNKAAK